MGMKALAYGGPEVVHCYRMRSSVPRPAVAGLILAGGRNSRMGGVEKSRIAVGGAPLVHSIARLLQSVFAEVILVSNQPWLHRDLAGRLVIISDLYKQRGPLGGIQAALQRTSAEAVFCVACDMPSLRRDLIQAQVREFRGTAKRGCQALIPRLGGLIEPLHGIYLKELEGLAREICAGPGGYSIRELLARARTCYWELEDVSGNRSAFFNLNTPKDLRVHLGESER
jgi:molybdopterin-guanine dinucleotide biosynthesis protein A